MSDQVHILIEIPPKYAVSAVVGYLKRERNYVGQQLWARGYFVDSVGRDTEVIRRYIREQESEDQRLDQLEFGGDNQTND